MMLIRRTDMDVCWEIEWRHPCCRGRFVCWVMADSRREAGAAFLRRMSVQRQLDQGGKPRCASCWMRKAYGRRRP